ncbi:MAG: hypothetical protein O3B13_04135 [Planctomycetota bacterium]|nr:hypothetical protein [Planctomycetota bacterium]
MGALDGHSSYDQLSGRQVGLLLSSPRIQNRLLMSQVCTLDVEVLSLYEAALQEARRHRWIESQKRGCDLGDQGFREWYDCYWAIYIRYRHLEHLLGDRQWLEFDSAAFGVLTPLVRNQDELAAEVVELYRQGWENLDILNWAIRAGLDLNQVKECLIVINMNDARIDHRLN